jgi:multiple sugar transport system permease protein
MSAWQWIGFNTVLFLAGLQNIPGELFEAATVDGAGKWAIFRHITIPMLAPTTFFVVTTAIISALQLFEQVYVLIPTEPPGGPNNSTLSLVLYLYIRGFQRFSQGYASAVAWVLFVVIFAVTLLQYRRQRAGGAYA